MHVLHPSDKFDRLEDVVVTVGTMDGVHIGHTAIARKIVNVARAQRTSSVVVTFDPHPREIVHGERVSLLTTIPERAEILGDIGVDYMYVLPFNSRVASLPPGEFVRTVLVHSFGVSHVVVGYDHGFGRGREGNVDVMRDLGETFGFEVTEVSEKTAGSDRVSSSRIRELLAEDGDVQSAQRLLGRPYSVSGLVIHGDGRGRAIGFPTANLKIDERKLLPVDGVYAVTAIVGDRELPGMMNIGVRPTFGANLLAVEVHIIDFDEDIYGQEIQVDFLKRIRSEQKFDSVEALRKQLSIDRDRCMGARKALI